MTSPQSTPEKVMRVSLGWVAAALGAVFFVGLGGGLVAQQLFRPSLPPLTDATNEPLRATVQQVTISPNVAAGELVQRTEQSAVVLAHGTPSEYTAVASGSVVTNDGLIVTAATDVETAQLAFDHQGRSIPLEFLGHDALYGFSYYRAHDALLAPLDVRADDAPVGQELLMLSRDATTFAPRVRPFRIFEFALPKAGDPAGIQRVLYGPANDEVLLTGSALLDDEGKIAGIVANAAEGRALTASQLKISLERMANNQREANPLADVGLALTHVFVRTADTQAAQFAVSVSAIAPNSPAELSTLEVGDAIIQINDAPVLWQQSVVQQLSAPLPLSLVLLRDGQQQTVQLQPAALQQ